MFVVELACLVTCPEHVLSLLLLICIVLTLEDMRSLIIVWIAGRGRNAYAQILRAHGGSKINSESALPLPRSTDITYLPCDWSTSIVFLDV